MSTQDSYSPEQLVEFAASALQAVAVCVGDAAVTASSLVHADTCGIYSHGLMRLPFYVKAIEAGGVNPKPHLHWLSEHGATGVLDADGALGQVAMAATVKAVAAKAKEFGVGAVSVQGSTHYGAGAYWTDQLAAQGFLSILTSTTGPVVAPYGGNKKVLGTNPLTLSAPSAGDHPLTADLATSSGAYGKILGARNEGRPIPQDWAVDAEGHPTTDPHEALAGSLTAFGGHKGSAIAVLLEAFAASLSHGAYSTEIQSIWNHPQSRMNTSHLLIALDAEAFVGRQHTKEKVAHLQDRIRGSGSVPVLAPGDPEHEKGASSTSGVVLPDSTVEALRELAERLNLHQLVAAP
ncbi:L-2-hydroxycarboxylate dehydrogenase (NAD+) [Arthrobacter sp. CAN_A6]|uniref:Ldh family oxidoreductase n=1 Tax=Arthrobacter sp. CAN_A6 TaxID=2787721 RepID=UPI0018CB348F